MKNNKIILNSIEWIGLDRQGYLEKPLKYNGPAIYIYMRKLSKDDVSFYVGSSIKLNCRVISHRTFVSKWAIKKYQKIGSPVFYKSVLKYGWDKFNFGVLEYLDLSEYTDIDVIKHILLEREQYYLDYINPSLNLGKIAHSPLGIKRTDAFKINQSKIKRGQRWTKSTACITSRIMSEETKLKISIRNLGVSVKVFDKSRNLIKEFPTLTSAASFIGCSFSTMSKIYKTGISYDDFIYEFEINSTRKNNTQKYKIWIYNSDLELIEVFESHVEVLKKYGLFNSTLQYYLKSGKLFRNTCYFFNTKTIDNLKGKTKEEVTLKNVDGRRKNIWVYNSDMELIEVLNSQKETIKRYNTCDITLRRYIKSGKLFRDCYYFFTAKTIDDLGSKTKY